MLDIGNRAAGARLDVMNFLNEAVSKYPAAISLASGRPSARFFDLDTSTAKIPIFLAHYARRLGVPVEKAKELLGQYGNTAGIIGDLVAKQLALDEGIHCDQEQIFITSGCQEGMSLCLSTFCNDNQDVLLVRNPTYAGITGAGYVNKINIYPIRREAEIGIVRALAEAIENVRELGGRSRALYLTPDFDNPTGTVLRREEREEIISLCAENQVVILEDNPYGMFRFDGVTVPTMYSLDKYGCVVYLGTYSKTIYPTLRVGYIVLPKRIWSSGVHDQISQRKSYSSLNTSQISQAIIGGILIEDNFTLSKRVVPATDFYRHNRDGLRQALAKGFSFLGRPCTCSVPEGGFFLTLNIGKPFLRTEMENCAREYGVVVMPLAFFSFDDSHDHIVRLAYSNVDTEQVEDGVNRFCRYLRVSQ